MPVEFVESDDDPYAVFGGDDDEEDDDDDDRPLQHPEAEKTASSSLSWALVLALHLVQVLARSNSQVPLPERKVAVLVDANAETEPFSRQLQACLGQKMLQSEMFTIKEASRLAQHPANCCVDAAILLCANCSTEKVEFLGKFVIGGGQVVMLDKSSCFLAIRKHLLARFEPVAPTASDCIPWAGEGRWISGATWPCLAAWEEGSVAGSSWLPPVDTAERLRLANATAPLSSYEIRQGQLTEITKTRAVAALQKFGFCIVPRLLDPGECMRYGEAALRDLHEAARILLQRDEVDLYRPSESTCEPAAYRELSMREDLRMDVRHGPHLDALRGSEGSRVATLSAHNATPVEGQFLRGNVDVLDIIRRTMNSAAAPSLGQGNMGRYNFDGSGPDGSFQKLRLGPVGGIVALPGCADQTLHADTAHLFEHLACLPAHYINVFVPGSSSNDRVGQTLFVHGSHQLDFTARHGMSLQNLRPYIVRPRLEPGDCLFFDCRILHFGMANRSVDVERPLLYLNATMDWFHDPKNWDNQRSIFDVKNDSSC